MKEDDHSEVMHHITLSSSILERMAVQYVEKATGKKVSAWIWIQNNDFGFAGFRAFFEGDEDLK